MQNGIFDIFENGNFLVGFYLCGVLMFGCCGIAAAQDDNRSGLRVPDNTKANAHRRANSQTSADQQSESGSDRAISRQVRKAIVKNKTVSSYAHNVKIVTQNGQVTLAGPIRSVEEKPALEDAAVSLEALTMSKMNCK